MVRSILVFALITGSIFVSSMFGQAARDWQKVTSAEGGFEALFPSAPARTTTLVDSATGKVPTTMFTSSFDDRAFLVSYSDYDVDITDPFDALVRSQTGGITTVGGTLVSSAATRHAGYPARVYTVRVEPQNGPSMIISVKAVLVGRRLYQTAVVYAEANGQPAEYARFASAFRIQGTGITAVR